MPGRGITGHEHWTCACLFRCRALGKREARTVIRFLASLVRTTLLTGLATLAFAVCAEPPGTSEAEQTPITRSTSSATTAEQASRWDLPERTGPGTSM